MNYFENLLNIDESIALLKSLELQFYFAPLLLYLVNDLRYLKLFIFLRCN